MQPQYITLSSSGAVSPWRLLNWQATPMEISFQVLSSGAAYSVAGTLEDPTGVYPNPRSSSPTAFTLFTGSSNAIFSLGSSATLANAAVTEPLAAVQFTLSSGSSIGPVVFIVLQSGVG